MGNMKIFYFFAVILVVEARWGRVQVTRDTTSEELTTDSTEETATTTMEPTTIELLQNITSPMGVFRSGFTSYEKRINIFLENMRRTYMTMYSENVKFIGELRKYEDQLPKNSIPVQQRFRARCYCENQWWGPCPERCMESCYSVYRGRWQTLDNCTKHLEEISNCYCYDESPDRCDNGKIHNCYNVAVVQEPPQEPCKEFAPNRTIVELSYTRFSELLTEPFKKLVRDLDFQLAFLKQSVLATDILNGLTIQTCGDQGETPCYPEASELIAKKLSHFKQLQRNLTLDMIKTQDQAEKVSKNLNNIKESMFTQMTGTIKNYTCCLKGLTFSVTDNECRTTPAEISTTTIHTPTISYSQKAQQCLARGDFWCDNRRCIHKDDQCDGYDDCGDGSDEANC